MSYGYVILNKRLVSGGYLLFLAIPSLNIATDCEDWNRPKTVIAG